ncbi:hypothetical protein FA13DRAFT_196385 [Coprinellus micaceus]|uniref:Uncharacterized protein n=1 Tax=Coprinellus micaceus TaxID=71717 RepID=A0A4Y7TID3_COPMI|nr:hypothetical protein FA13DRAFT_196385 [Coprinellus micaceus]
MDKPNVLVPSFGLSRSFHLAPFFPPCASLCLPPSILSLSCSSSLLDLILTIPHSFCVFVVYIGDDVSPTHSHFLSLSLPHSFGRTLSFCCCCSFAVLWNFRLSSSLFYDGLFLRSFEKVCFWVSCCPPSLPLLVLSFCRPAVILSNIHSLRTYYLCPTLA